MGTIHTLLTVVSLAIYAIAMLRGVLYIRGQHADGLPAPGWIVPGALFATACVIFLLLALTELVPAATMTTFGLLIFLLGSVMMNIVIGILDR